MLPIDESKSDSKKNPTTNTTSSLSSSPPTSSSVSTPSAKKVVTMDEKSITNDQSNITAKSPNPHSNVVADTTTSTSSSTPSKSKSNKHKKRSASFQTGNVYLNLQKESSEQTFPPPSMMNPMDKKTSIINYIPDTNSAVSLSQINPQHQAQVPMIVPPPPSVPHHQHHHHHHQVNFQPVPTFYDPNNSANFTQPQGTPLPQSTAPAASPPPQTPSVPVPIPPRPTSPPMVSSFSFEQQRPPPPLPPQPVNLPSTTGSGHSNPMVSFQMEPSQEEPHSLPPPQLPPPSPPLSSSSTTTRTLSASDPDLYYMSLPPVKMSQTTVTPLLNVDKIQSTIHEQSQQIQQQQDEQQQQQQKSRKPSFQRERSNNDRSIRFDQQASANPTNTTNQQSMRSSKSMKVLPGHRRQTPPHHQSTFQNITLQDAQKQSQSRQRMAQSRRSLASPRHSQMSHAKSTNLSNMRLSYPYSDPDISDIEINNNYIDNNNASDDSEAMAILPIEARDLLMQEEEERKSRLAKESTSLLRVPGYGARRESKYFPGRIRKRVILKNGNINLCPEHVDKRSQRYLQDTFTTMVDIRWRWNLLVFAMGFIMSWFAFSIIWWLIAFSHSDFEHLHDEEWTPCVANMRNFASAFLFSIETQHTIGYGSRYTTEECPEALFVMCLQSITGVMIQCFMVGFVFAKLSRPQKRSQTLMFSRYAIVNSRDSKLCLMFRVGDLRDRSHIIGCTITAQIIRKKITEEGEMIPYFHQKLDVKFDEIDDEVFLIWPAIIVHVIDKNSPFYTMNADDMMREKFEIIAILEGTVESTGQTVQARTSYLPSEILWGHRFEQLIRYRHDTGEYLVDYSKFNNTFEVDVPFCSAKELEEELKARRQEQQQQQQNEDEDQTQSEED